jgi:hypothetical protein
MACVGSIFLAAYQSPFARQHMPMTFWNDWSRDSRHIFKEIPASYGMERFVTSLHIHDFHACESLTR